MCELQANLSDVETEKHKFESATARLKSQLELAEKNSAWAEEQLAKKSETLLTARSGFNAKIEELKVINILYHEYTKLHIPNYTPTHKKIDLNCHLSFVT